jgi:hypothetical protein
MDIDRRKFLGSTTALLALTLAACGKKTKGLMGSTTGPAANELNVALATNDLVENTKSRVAFILRKGDATLPQSKVDVAIDSNSSGKFEQKVETTFHSDTQGGVAYYTFQHEFGKSATYFAQIKSRYGTITASINVVPASAITMPKPGDQMIPFDSPTTQDHRGVNPICTRVPPCAMHDVTISQALSEKKPVLVAFATPALCQTATCGPVVDVVLAVKDSFPNVHYLHEEIYTDETGKTSAPTPSAYKLQSEPMVYLAKSDGTVHTRFDGIFGETELRNALKQLS